MYFPRVVAVKVKNEPRHEKTAKAKAQINCVVTARLISAFGIATRIVKFSSSYILTFRILISFFLRLYRPVCVGTGRKTRRSVFSCRSSNYVAKIYQVLSAAKPFSSKILSSIRPIIWHQN